MKYIKRFEALKNINIEETTPEYYTKQYTDDETFNSMRRTKKGEFKETQYSAKEFRDIFMYWYNQIEPELKRNNKWEVFEILSNWDEECLAKMDLYTLVKKHFQIEDEISKYNL